MMNPSRRTIWLAALAISPMISYAAERLSVSPTPHLANGGIAHVNKAFQAKTGVEIVMPEKPGGCGAAVLGLKTGKIDAGVMCCPPNKEEIGNLDLVASVVAKEAIAVTVHDSNPVTGLSTEQLRDIYQGRITNWNQVGGKDAPISVYGYIMCGNREEPARQYIVGVRDYKKGVMGIDNGKLAKSVTRVKPGAELFKRVAADPNGIGFEATIYLPVSGAKAIKLDGISPSQDALRNGTYPAIRHLYILTKGYPSGRTKEYIEFLRSPEGQTLLEKEGNLVKAVESGIAKVL